MLHLHLIPCTRPHANTHYINKGPAKRDVRAEGKLHKGPGIKALVLPFRLIILLTIIILGPMSSVN